MRMTHGMWCAHGKLTTWATRVRVNQLCKYEKNVTCEVCCSHTPSVAADCCQLQTFWLQQKMLQSLTSEQLCEETAQRVSPFYMLFFHELRCAWLFINFWWAPPGIVPLPPRCAGWIRRRMPFLVLPGRNLCESLFSRLTVKTVQFC